jgi:phosphatidate cytidylyltransferase
VLLLARAEPASGTLARRILSALVLAPAAVAAAWFGWPWLPLVVAVFGAGMVWEWARLCQAGRIGSAGGALMAAVPAAVAAAALGRAGVGLGIAAAGAALAFTAARPHRDGAPAWLALGALWIALPCVSFVWIAGKEAAGRDTVLWIFAVVWATDIGAYGFGRLLGGPRLAPRLSPRKTWAGLIGGAGCAALAGWGTARILGSSAALPLVVLTSAGLAIIEQFGDLAESAAKRRFGVKDSSGLIPGHGGLLDRLDGLLAVTPAVALLTLFDGNVVIWR